ncbi:FG-GAP-like repeat-containing protein [Bradyrhizobium sp. USDA 4529]
MATYTHYNTAVDPSLENLFFGGFSISLASSTSVVVTRSDGMVITLTGTGFSQSYDQNLGYTYSGTVTSVAIADANGSPVGGITGESVSLADIFIPNGTEQPYALTGSLFTGSDTLLGNNGDEHLNGGSGNDIVNGFGGANRIDGGAGFDIVNINASWTTASFQHNADGSWTIGFNGGFDLVQNVESVHFSDATIALREPTHDDFGGLGHSNALFYNPANGAVSDFAASGTLKLQFFLGASYNLVGTGDFNGDGTTDIAARSPSAGGVSIIEEKQNNANSVWTAGGSSASYSAVGVGDFNGDGLSDVLFRNNSTGDFGYNQTSASGGHVTGAAYVPIGGSSNSYQVEAVGDFNGDSVSDILFRNDATGDMGFVFMKAGGTSTGYQPIGGSSPAFSVVGAGDFNGDGTTDILFRNNSTGDFGFDQINNGVNTGYHALGGSSSAFHVATVGDFNGDGTADIMFRNATTGENGYYELHNGVLGAWHQVQTVDPAYTIVV